MAKHPKNPQGMSAGGVKLPTTCFKKGPFRGVYKKTEGRNGVFPLGGQVQILEFEIAKV